MTYILAPEWAKNLALRRAIDKKRLRLGSNSFFWFHFLLSLLISFCLWDDCILVVSATRVESKSTQKC